MTVEESIVLARSYAAIIVDKVENGGVYQRTKTAAVKWKEIRDECVRRSPQWRFTKETMQNRFVSLLHFCSDHPLQFHHHDIMFRWDNILKPEYEIWNTKGFGTGSGFDWGTATLTERVSNRTACHAC